MRAAPDRVRKGWVYGDQSKIFVSGCMIVRNEVGIAEHAVASLGGLADEVVVVDTGSTDGTPGMLESMGCRVILGGDRYDLGGSKNMAMDHAQGEWIVFVDADERVRNPVYARKLLAWTPARILWVKFHNYHGGRLTWVADKLRIWRKDTMRFKYHYHEVPIATKGMSGWLTSPLVWIHDQPTIRDYESRGVYGLECLMLDYQEDPDDPRTVRNIAIHYHWMGQKKKALSWLKRVLQMDGIDHRMRAEMHAHLGDCYRESEDVDRAVDEYELACELEPTRRRWRGELAEIYIENGELRKALVCLEQVMKMRPRRMTFREMKWHGAYVEDLLSRCREVA